MPTKPAVILSDLGEVLLSPTELAKQHPAFTGKMNPVYAALEQTRKEGSTYRFEDYFELNRELLDHFSTLKKQGVDFFMLTEGSMQNDPAIHEDLATVFTRIYSAKNDFNRMKKTDPELYLRIKRAITEDLGREVAASDILFIDDSEANAAAAKESGLQATQFTSNEKIIEQLNWREERPQQEGTIS